ERRRSVATTKARGSARKVPARRAPGGKIPLNEIVVLKLKEDLENAPRPLLEAIRNTLRVSRDDVKNAILTRSLSLTRRAMEHVSPGTLGEAVAASTDQEAMLRILEAPEMAASALDTATIDAARVAGIEARDQLLTAQGGSWPVERVAKYLGLTRQAVDKRRKANKLIGLTVGRHGYLYPSWQFSRSGTVPGLEDVLGALHRHDPWSQVIFLLSPNDRLDGVTPLEALRKGQTEDVKIAASLFGEHGAA
ncbi:MAG: hypothetical protein ACT4PY_15055, partial [Armatimonadota bacterium]